MTIAEGPRTFPLATLTCVAGLTSRATRAATVNCGDGGIYVRPERYVDWINEVLKPFGIKLP